MVEFVRQRSDGSITSGQLAGVIAIATTVLIAVPLVGWPPVVRLPAVLVPALALGVAVLRPWHWNRSSWDRLDAWIPSNRSLLWGALGLTLLLSWIVFTRFQSGGINGGDFTVYYDRPCVQTLRGRALLVETADFPKFSHMSAIGHHAYWSLFPLCGLYAFGASPLWLLAVSVVAVVAGAVYTVRIVLALGGGGLLAVTSGLAFALNDNTARALNFGFHPEVLYAWCIPWLLHAGLQKNRYSFIAAVLACVSVKEDAILPLVAVAIALGLHRFRTMNAVDRVIFLATPPLLGLANLALFWGYIAPRLTPDGELVYAAFWADYGTPPLRALPGMLTAPWRVFVDILTSGFLRLVILPTLFLSFIGWRWMLAMAPMVAVYATASDLQLRGFGIYYAIVLVPFLTVAGSIGAMKLSMRVMTNSCCTRIAAATLVLAGALLVGSGNGGYSLQPWRSEIAAVPEALTLLATERLILVQSSLYPHTGYDGRIQLLTPSTLRDPTHAGAAVLVAPAMGTYPFEVDDMLRISQLPTIHSIRGLLAVRIPAQPAPLDQITPASPGVEVR
jgi:uncharacterized membrane protein